MVSSSGERDVWNSQRDAVNMWMCSQTSLSSLRGATALFMVSCIATSVLSIVILFPGICFTSKLVVYHNVWVQHNKQVFSS